MTVALVVAAVLVLVAVIALAALPVLDRRLAAQAEHRAGAFLAQPFGRPATVRVADRPFLTQAIRGIYRGVHVTGTDLRIGEITGASLDARLHNVYLSLRELARRSVRELPCEHVEGRMVLPYAEVARVARDAGGGRFAGLDLRPSRGRVIATAALPVPGISQLARVSGMAVLELGAGNTVWLRVRGVSVAGINLPTVVLQQLLPSLDVPLALPAMPYGLQIDEVQPGADGLIVLGSARAAVFRGQASTDLTVGRDRPRPAPRPEVRPASRDGRPGR